MGREARRRAAQSAHQKTSHQAPPPGLERRQTLIEHFATANVQVMEIEPGDEQFPTDLAQVGLLMSGQPAFLTRGPKTYLTFFTPESAVTVGEAMLESGRLLAEKAPTAAANGLVTVGSMREAEAVARQREQTEALRSG